MTDQVTPHHAAPAMPRFMVLLYASIVLLGLAYVADFVIGSPSDSLQRFVDLDQDQNLSTWFSSLLWFGAAALSWVFATRVVTMADRWSWPLVLLPLLFLAFSIDEVARLHEALGYKLDGFVLGVDREETILRATGVWVVVFGVPLVIALVLLALAVARRLRDYRSAFVKILIGMSLLLAGALGVEALSNFVEFRSAAGIMQVLVEETLEMVGSATVLWGCYELVRDTDGAADSA